MKENSNNLDAVIPSQLAFVCEGPDAAKMLEGAEKIGRIVLKERLGKNCFEDDNEHMGHFWGIIDTRPYMCVLQALVHLCFEQGRFNESTNTIFVFAQEITCPSVPGLDHFPSVQGDTPTRYSFPRSGYTLVLMTKVNRPIAFQAPTKDVMTVAREKTLSEWSCGAQLYTAALASFGLFGFD